MTDATPHNQAPADVMHSRYVQRIRRRYAAELQAFASQFPGAPLKPELQALLNLLLAEGRPLAEALRVTRQLLIERLATLDISQQIGLAEVIAAMTQWAELSLQMALADALAEQDLRFGAPLDSEGKRIDLWIVGMGKLGGRELNVSSDIDLVYVYECDGITAGQADGAGQLHQQITAHEYFSHVVRSIQTLIGETTDNGFVFRMDLALRPNGMSGPPVVSLAMLEEYFLVQGREWERFAWLKSRIVAPAAAMPGGERHATSLAMRDIVTPFVYRRYLDYGVFESLRQLHQKICDDANRRTAGRPGRGHDVKLSRGGIREIEFTVQLLQVVRGGQYPEIRTRSTLKALKRLAQLKLIDSDVAHHLANAYVFLRQIEHRIQYLDDQQTHCLPTEDADLAWIADSMGLSEAPSSEPSSDPECHGSTCELMSALCQVREYVANEFNALLHEAAPKGRSDDCKKCGAPPALESEAFLAKLPPKLTKQVQAFIAQPRVALMTEVGKTRLAQLIYTACKLAAETAASEQIEQEEAEDQVEKSVSRLMDWLTPLLRRESYLSLLIERPGVLKRLLRLLGLARWPMRYLMQHPGVIDELADPRLLEGRFDKQLYLDDLAQRYAAWSRHGEANEEVILEALRRAHHAEVFRILVRDVDGAIGVEDVADDLSDLAEATVEMACRWAWVDLQQRPGKQGQWAVDHEPCFAIIAYGKLGGRELGYGSDLDLVFLYDLSEGEASSNTGPDSVGPLDAYIVFARKLITWLTLRTAAGELFDIDMALRPNGHSGLLVTSVQAFDNYQRQRGSNTAWTWEHQALSRARWCAGNRSLRAAFETTRRAVLTTPRDRRQLRLEINAMRERLREAHPTTATRFDLKHGKGGMVDIEFAVQYLVLAHSHEHPQLLDNVGNIALLKLAEQVGLLPDGVGERAGKAYRRLRQLQHRARLNEAATVLTDHALFAEQNHIHAGLDLWQAVFPTP